MKTAKNKNEETKNGKHIEPQWHIYESLVVLWFVHGAFIATNIRHNVHDERCAHTKYV